MLTLAHDVQLLPSTHLTVALLNVRFIVSKLNDIHADHFLNSADVLCFCETPEQPSPIVKADHVIHRCDRATSDHKGGTMLC